MIIRNKKQYTAVHKQLQNLLEDIKDTEQVLKQNPEEIQLKLQLSTFKKGAKKLQHIMNEYKRLTSDQLTSLTFDSLKDDMNKAIISFRIASGISQKELAKEMYIQEQQIQRYEQNDYLSASFERILQLLEVLEVQIVLKKDFHKQVKEYFSPELLEINNKIKERGTLLNIEESV
ncbi:helix-turn-helix domain-containing protein [Bacteroides gallinarum]|uniref:helix-turn-helix domain-containing protein n=1 Tax=Bacteroides gallinarum TaxID=376806 RepID=UPI00037A240C|nr:helix-turn-helix transcriptional regulator [Bacteroides gallinarum]